VPILTDLTKETSFRRFFLQETAHFVFDLPAAVPPVDAPAHAP